MYTNKIKLLDCTLRDGGYINNWKWGFKSAQTIISFLQKANIDVIEVGFLRNVEVENPSVTVGNTISFLNKFLPETSSSDIMFSAMAMKSNYNVEKLEPYNGHGIELIRVTAHDYDILEGIEFAKEIQNRGYKVSVNPINIMGYTDAEVINIVNKVNEIHPYQFSIVDTFGSMKIRDLNRIVELVDHNLNFDIRLGLHLHENMSLSYSLAQTFVEKHLKRPIMIDASLMGMGRTPGNLPIELMADYLNDSTECNYDLDFLMDAIQGYIYPYKKQSTWGYVPAYFLSAKYNLHRNYAEFYLKKDNLTTRNINNILSRVDKEKTTVFDEDYANHLLREFIQFDMDDNKAMTSLKEELIKKEKILLIVPGASLKKYKQLICDFIMQNSTTVISLNYIPEKVFHCDYVFFSNNKRYNMAYHKQDIKIIATSNLHEFKADYFINYNSLVRSFPQGGNSLVLALTMLKKLGFNNIVIAGADGYTSEGYQYIDDSLELRYDENNCNKDMMIALKKLDINLKFLTPSAYDYANEMR